MPPDDSREVLCYVLLVSFLTIWTTPQRRPGKRISGVGTYVALEKFTQTFRSPSPKFYRGPKLRDFASIFDSTRAWRAVYTKRSNKSKSKTSTWSADEWAFWLRHCPHLSPKNEIKNAKFGLNLVFGTLQFRNAATHIKSEIHISMVGFLLLTRHIGRSHRLW